MADIVYSLSPSSSASNTAKTLEFYREMTRGLDMQAGRVRVGMVPKDCGGDLSKLSYSSRNAKQNILNQLDAFLDSQTTVADVINYMRCESFSRGRGARRGARRMGVLVVDEGDDFGKSMYEARRARDLAGIELFVIGVGRRLSYNRLCHLASSPPSKHVFIVRSYNELPSILTRVRESVCPSPYP